MKKINEGYTNKPSGAGSGERALEELRNDGQKVLDELMLKARNALEKGDREVAAALIERHKSLKGIVKDENGGIISADIRS
jgi:phage shock protein A